jgi:hypothetical protein
VSHNHTFKTADELFDFLQKKRRPQLKPHFAKQVQAFERFARERSA